MKAFTKKVNIQTKVSLKPPFLATSLNHPPKAQKHSDPSPGNQKKVPGTPAWVKAVGHASSGSKALQLHEGLNGISVRFRDGWCLVAFFDDQKTPWGVGKKLGQKGELT